MQACSNIYLKILDGVKVSIIKEPKLLFEKTQLNDKFFEKKIYRKQFAQ